MVAREEGHGVSAPALVRPPERAEEQADQQPGSRRRAGVAQPAPAADLVAAGEQRLELREGDVAELCQPERAGQRVKAPWRDRARDPLQPRSQLVWGETVPTQRRQARFEALVVGVVAEPRQEPAQVVLPRSSRGSRDDVGEHREVQVVVRLLGLLAEQQLVGEGRALAADPGQEGFAQGSTVPDSLVAVVVVAVVVAPAAVVALVVVALVPGQIWVVPVLVAGRAEVRPPPGRRSQGVRGGRVRRGLLVARQLGLKLFVSSANLLEGVRVALGLVALDQAGVAPLELAGQKPALQPKEGLGILGEESEVGFALGTAHRARCRSAKYSA